MKTMSEQLQKEQESKKKRKSIFSFWKEEKDEMKKKLLEDWDDSDYFLPEIEISGTKMSITTAEWKSDNNTYAWG